MFRMRRSLIALLLFSWGLLLTTSGCAMFQQQEPPKRPKTVEEWMAQPRVQP